MTDSVSKKLGKVIQIDEEQIREHLGNLVRGTVEETLNKLLDAEGRSALQRPLAMNVQTPARIHGLATISENCIPKPVRSP